MNRNTMTRIQFPSKPWEQLTADEQDYFSEMSKENLVSRWKGKRGEQIRERIIAINYSNGSSEEYKDFVGTVKTDLTNEPAKIDLRGLDFSNFSNLKDNTIFGFDFSNCSLHYSNFEDSDLDSSCFHNSNILYSNFSGANLSNCDFSKCNLTLSRFTDARLEYANFKDTWLTMVSFVGADLGFVKFDSKTDFQTIDISQVHGTSNPLFLSFIRRKLFLKNFKEQNVRNRILYYVWLVISDCGQSFLRWSVASIVICLLFGFLYGRIPGSFQISNDRVPTPFTFYYYSIVTFTTLGFGDVVPKDILGEVAVAVEVIIGYIMLGGLISIFATRFVPKS